MNWQSLVSTVLVFVGTPTIIIYGFYAIQLIGQKHPSHTIPHLERFASMAVRKVQKNYPNGESAQKKALAVQTVKVLFAAHPPLKAPPDTAIDIAIESALFLLPKE